MKSTTTNDFLIVTQRRVLPAVASLLALLTPLLLFWVLNDRIMKSGQGYDGQFFVWGGWCITRGLRPYVDFFEFKPPMVFITHAFAIWTCGDKGFFYRIFFSVFAATSTLALHLSLLSRRVNRAVSVALICALVFAWVNPVYHDNALQDAESIGLSYYFIGIAALFADTGRYRRYFEAVGGAFLTCTVFSKEPFAGAVVGAWISAFFLIYRTENFKANAGRYLLFTGLGIAAVVAALSAYMVPTGSMRRYFELFREYAALFRDPHTSYCVVLGRWTPSTPLRELRAQIAYIRAGFFNAPTIGYLTPFLIASIVFIWRDSKILFACCVATFLLALYAVTATNCQWLHYYNMALSGMFFVFVVGVDRMNASIALCSRALRTYVSGLLLAVVAVFAYPRVEQELQVWPYQFAAVTESVPGVFDFVAKHSSPNDKILTTGPPQLYMNVHRLSAIRESSLVDEFLLYYRGDTDVEKVAHLRAQLVKNRPKIIILDPEHADRKRRHMEALLKPFLADFKYEAVGPYFYVRPD